MGYRAVGSDFASKLKTKRTARIGIAVLVFGMLALITQAQFEPIDARVVRVIDGDTIRVPGCKERSTPSVSSAWTPQRRYTRPRPCSTLGRRPEPTPRRRSKGGRSSFTRTTLVTPATATGGRSAMYPWTAKTSTLRSSDAAWLMPFANSVIRASSTTSPWKRTHERKDVACGPVADRRWSNGRPEITGRGACHVPPRPSPLPVCPGAPASCQSASLGFAVCRGPC